MGKRPDYNLCLKPKADESAPWRQVGVAWVNDKGQLHLRLDLGVVLSWRDLQDHHFTLFPSQERE